MGTKLELLMKPVWTYKDIMQFDTNIKSKTTAIKIKNRAIKEYKGNVKYGTLYATTDSVLALYGTTREKEIAILERLERCSGSSEIQKELHSKETH